MLDITCPSCGERYHVAPEHTGRSIRCTRCERVFEVVAPRQTTATAGTATAASAGEAASASSGAGSAGPHGSPVPDRPFVVGDQDFAQRVLQSPAPVVVDFWAAWCGPCRAIAPAIEQLAGEYGGRVGFAKLNADENPRTMAQYGVMGLPTLVLFKGGREVGRLVGLRNKAAIKQAIDKVA
jgi:thioredoxin 1